MKVSEVITESGKTRYMLQGDDGLPHVPVLKYLKYKDYSGAARNTLRLYCYQLKLYFEYLQEKQVDFTDVNINDIAGFIYWLQYSDNVIPIQPTFSRRSAKTINLAVSVVMGFYEYLSRFEEYENQLRHQLTKYMAGSRKGFKDMLFHISRKKQLPVKLLKLKEPKHSIKTIPKDDVFKLISSCNNFRDKFLTKLLWESSVRIGEALSLWLEDFDIDKCVINIKDRGELENHAEIKTVCSERKIDVSQDLMNMYFQYLALYHLDDVDTNHVFIKLAGEKKNQPMEYSDVAALFRKLRLKTDISATPHTLRHTSLSALKKAGVKDEVLMKRAGHAHVQTTLQTYVHTTDEDVREEWKKVQKNMSEERKNE